MIRWPRICWGVFYGKGVFCDKQPQAGFLSQETCLGQCALFVADFCEKRVLLRQKGGMASTKGFRRFQQNAAQRPDGGHPAFGPERGVPPPPTHQGCDLLPGQHHWSVRPA